MPQYLEKTQDKCERRKQAIQTLRPHKKELKIETKALVDKA